MAEVEKVQVLGIVGSPRRGGNTDVLVDTVLSGAEEAGAVVEKVRLSKLDIGYCRACDVCRKKGHCIQKDDMDGLVDKMRASQVWVFGTPIYWYGPSAQFKTFLDRWYGLNGTGSLDFKGRRVVLVTPLEETDPAGARHTTGMLAGSLEYVGADLVATIVVPGVTGPGEVRKLPDVLETARQAGRAVVAG